MSAALIAFAQMAGALTAGALMVGPQTDVAVEGLWRTPSNGGSLVRLAPCGDDLCGTIVTSPRLKTHPDQRDQLNARPDQRGRPLKGLRILRASPEGPGKWGGGWVYNPEDGKTYKGSIRLLPDGRLKLTGCVVAPLCKTQVWTRMGN